MPITTLSSLDFDPAALRAAAYGPVFLTENGRASHVLLSFDEYSRIAGSGETILEMLGDPAVAEIDFDLPPREISPERPLDLE